MSPTFRITPSVEVCIQQHSLCIRTSRFRTVPPGFIANSYRECKCWRYMSIYESGAFLILPWLPLNWPPPAICRQWKKFAVCSPEQLLLSYVASARPSLVGRSVRPAIALSIQVAAVFAWSTIRQIFMTLFRSKYLCCTLSIHRDRFSRWNFGSSSTFQWPPSSLSVHGGMHYMIHRNSGYSIALCEGTRAAISPVDLLTMEAVLRHPLLFCNMKVENFSVATFWCTRSSNQWCSAPTC